MWGHWRGRRRRRAHGRKNVPAATSGTDRDYQPPIADGNRRLHAVMSAGATDWAVPRPHRALSNTTTAVTIKTPRVLVSAQITALQVQSEAPRPRRRHRALAHQDRHRRTDRRPVGALPDPIQKLSLMDILLAVAGFLGGEVEWA